MRPLSARRVCLADVAKRGIGAVSAPGARSHRGGRAFSRAAERRSLLAQALAAWKRADRARLQPAFFAGSAPLPGTSRRGNEK
jgi:hypothetical protein